MSRPSWDAYFMDLAEMVSSRSTCNRKHVGAVIVQDRRMIASGYNGSIPGGPHCDDVGHDMMGQHCVHCGVIREKATEGCTSVKAPYNPQSGVVDHEWEGGNCVRTVHAEVNAIVQAAHLGVSTKGATLYTNTYPCWPCMKVILTAGIARVIYDSDYRPDPRVEAAVQSPDFLVKFKR